MRKRAIAFIQFEALERLLHLPQNIHISRVITIIPPNSRESQNRFRVVLEGEGLREIEDTVPCPEVRIVMCNFGPGCTHEKTEIVYSDHEWLGKPFDEKEQTKSLHKSEK